MGAILSYFFPESDQSDQSNQSDQSDLSDQSAQSDQSTQSDPATTIVQLVEEKSDSVMEELSATNEETEPAESKVEDFRASDLANEKEFEVIDEASGLPVIETEEGFEVVQENRLNTVLNAISEGNGDQEDESSDSMEASPEPLTVRFITPEPIKALTPEPTKAITLEPTVAHIHEPIQPSASEPVTDVTPQPASTPTTQLTNQSSPGPGMEVELIGSVDDNNTNVQE